MSSYMYILQCSDGSYYTGSTKNIEARLYQHQNGEGAKHTKTRLPVKLVYVEEFECIDEAFYREKQIQGWGRKKKEALIAGDFDKLSHLSRSKTDFDKLSHHDKLSYHGKLSHQKGADFNKDADSKVAELVEATKRNAGSKDE